MNEEQQHAFDVVVNKRQNTFIHGVAGTGKTYMLRHIIEALKSQGLNGLITGTTGKSHKNLGICGTRTLHSAMLWMPECRGTFNNMLNRGLEDALGVSNAQYDYIIVEEVSMLSNQLFDNLILQLHLYQYEHLIDFAFVTDFKQQNAKSSKLVRRMMDDILKNGYSAKTQLILVGDLRQLEPVNAGYINTSDLFHVCKIEHVRLMKQIRQKDEKLRKILNIIRDNNDIMNNREVQDFFARNDILVKQPSTKTITSCVHIFTRVSALEEYNKKMMQQFKPSDIIRYKGKAEWKCKTKYRHFHQLPESEERSFAVGMHVVVTANISNTEIVNGDTGIITKFTNSIPEGLGVEIRSPTNGTFTIFPIRETFYDAIKTDDDSERVNMRIYVTEDLPILPAYGYTVHRIQGATLPQLVVHLDRKNNIFARGQLYTMLSRATSEEHLYIDYGSTEDRKEALKLVAKSQSKLKSAPSDDQFRPTVKIQSIEDVTTFLSRLNLEPDKILPIDKRRLLRERKEASLGKLADNTIIPVIEKLLGYTNEYDFESVKGTERHIACRNCHAVMNERYLLQIGLYCPNDCGVSTHELCEELVLQHMWFVYILQSSSKCRLSEEVDYVGIATTKERPQQSIIYRELDVNKQSIRVSLSVGESDMIRLLQPRLNKMQLGGASLSNHARCQDVQHDIGIDSRKLKFSHITLCKSQLLHCIDFRVISSNSCGDLHRGESTITNGTSKYCYFLTRDENLEKSCTCKIPCGWRAKANALHTSTRPLYFPYKISDLKQVDIPWLFLRRNAKHRRGNNHFNLHNIKQDMLHHRGKVGWTYENIDQIDGQFLSMLSANQWLSHTYKSGCWQSLQKDLYV